MGNGRSRQNPSESVLTPLKSVEQHNREKREAREQAEEARKRTGVACPGCGEELRWVGEYRFAYLTLPIPHTRPAQCPCGIKIDLEV